MNPRENGYPGPGRGLKERVTSALVYILCWTALVAAIIGTARCAIL